MVNLKQLLTDISKAIVNSPDDVVVVESENDKEIILELHVAPDDMGKVIGRQGKIAKSIRLVMKSAANTINKKVTVNIVD